MTLAELPEQVAKTPATPTREQLGVQVQALAADLAKQFGYETGQGVTVSQVDPGSPADNAGIKPGTLILSVDQKAVNNLDQYHEAIKAAEAQKTVLLLIRQGEMVRYVVLRWE